MEDFKKPNLPIAPALNTEKDQQEENIKDTFDRIEDSSELNQSQSPYKIPKWSDKANKEKNYGFEVLKSGQIIDEIKELQKKEFWSFGRLPENDIEMAHPTVSRFHAILQYRPKGNNLENSDEETNSPYVSPPEGWYIYDLGSTHGTFLNKQRLPPKVYIRIKVGHLLKLGASTRSYILQGPADDEEPESKLSITEIKEKRQQEIERDRLEKKRLADEAVEKAKNEGCGWGMAEDADEESDLTHNPYATTNNEELFFEDPKKTLRGYFEREGMELLYKCDEMTVGSFVCRVELPIDDTNGRSIIAEVVHKGKKKDCVIQCALEACRILDRHGVLRQANQEPLKRKHKSQGSDSDDDDFWDRTGDVAKKKEKKALANVSVTLTYEDLLKQENVIDEQLKEITCKIDYYQNQQQRIKSQKSEEGEDLDTYMENLRDKDTKLDKTEIRKLRLEEQRLTNEKHKVQKLIKIAKPAEILFSQSTEEKPTKTKTEQTAKKQFQMIGKRNQFSKFKIVNVIPTKDVKPKELVNSEEEEDEEDICTEYKEQKEKNVATEKFSVKNFFDERKTEKTDENEEFIATTNIKNHIEKSESTSETLLDSESVISKDIDSNKKRRHRIRQRNKRGEVNGNHSEAYESSEKYAKWLPPENQTGDGLTELNKKFGY